jgi:hypothetical protein
MYPDVYYYFMHDCKGDIHKEHPSLPYDTWYPTEYNELLTARLAEACMQRRKTRFSVEIIEQEIELEVFREETEAARKGREPRPLKGYDQERVFRQDLGQTSLLKRVSRVVSRFFRHAWHALGHS